MEHGRIGIVTVLYNSTEVLEAFFDSLDRQACCNFVLYVVDNASTDGSLEKARELSARVDFRSVFIPNSHNGGIAQGNNVGVRTARLDGCDWVLLSNNDTVWRPDTLSALWKDALKYQAGMVVPKILTYGTGEVWYGGGHWDCWRGGTKHEKHTGNASLEKEGASREVEYAPTCVMLIHRRVFDRIGMMDERFFVYYDDSDFVFRAAQAGEKLLYVSRSVVEHREGISIGNASPSAQYWLSRNLILFTRKHFSKPYLVYVILINLFILFFKRPFTFSRRQWNASFRGYSDGVRICRNQPRPLIALPVCTD